MLLEGNKMKAHHYFAIAFRCAAIYLLLYGLRSVSYIEQVIFISQGLMKAVSIALFILPFIIAALFWFFPVTLSKLLLPPECNNDVTPVNSFSVHSIIISSIGLLLLTSAIPDIVYYLAIYNIESETPIMGFSPENKASVISTIVELIFAVTLIFKSKIIASYIQNK
jgi:hypothetical protein